MADTVNIDLFKQYDVTTTAYTYGRFARTFLSLPKGAKTSGSSTTTVDITAGDEFAIPLGVGDELYEPVQDLRRFVTAKASNSSITVSSAWNLGSGTNLQFRKFFSGTAVTDGWVDCAMLTSKSITLEVATINATSITFTIEGRVPGSAPSTIYTSAALAAASIASSINNLAPIEIPESVEAIRVGVKLDTDGGAQSVSARLFGVQR